MQAPHVTTFFYGSYINFEVLAEVPLAPARFEVARLPGFDIQITPLANVVRCDQACVYGILAPVTHEQLDRLYAHARDVLGGVYLPHPVLAETREGKWVPALCYIAPDLPSQAAQPDYVQRIVEPARAYGFPDDYVRRLEAFAG